MISIFITIECFFKLSAWAATAMRAGGCSFLPSATEYADTDARQQRIDRQNYWSELFLPVRAILYVVLMLVFYPLFLFFALLQALYTRLVRGGPWASLGKQGVFGCHPDYPCQFVFTKPYDVEKLEALFRSMEAKFKAEMGLVDAEGEGEAAEGGY